MKAEAEAEEKAEAEASAEAQAGRALRSENVKGPNSGTNLNISQSVYTQAFENSTCKNSLKPVRSCYEVVAGSLEEKLVKLSGNPSRRISATKSGEGGGKYYVAAEVNGSLVCLFFDTGAEVSLWPLKYQESGRGGKVETLNTPISLRGFDDVHSCEITRKTEIELNFSKVSVRAGFYLCDVPQPLIGNDILRNVFLNVSIDTKSEMITLGSVKMKTRDSVRGAKEQFKKEIESSSLGKVTRETPSWVRASKKTIIPPRSVSMINYDIVDDKDEIVILSNHDNDDLDVFIPSVKRNTKNSPKQIIVENRRNRSIVIPKGFVIGESKSVNSISSGCTIESYSISELKEAWSDENEREFGVVVEDENPSKPENPATPKFPPDKTDFPAENT